MIELINVSKIFPAGAGVRALQEVNLKVAEGEYVGILGPSGSGKSTLLNLLGLLDAPTSGILNYGGRDTTTFTDQELSKFRGQFIGFVFQSFHLINHLSIIENVELPLFYQGVPAHERRQRATAQLEAVNLGHRLTHRPRQLSGGECQRVAISRALVTNPPMILADEPTGNLDSKSGQEILAIFDSLHRQGKTLIVITHDLHVAQRIPRIVRIADGILTEGAGT
ncbi:MAG: ABC transporter ATP-binding protein [bacterium]